VDLGIFLILSACTLTVKPAIIAFLLILIILTELLDNYLFNIELNQNKYTNFIFKSPNSVY